MRKSTTLNLGTGTFVLLGFAALFFLTTQTTSRGITFFTRPPHYELIAKFDNIGDLKVGAPVSMSGVEMGRVAKIAFDSREYKAVVTLRMDARYTQIPTDSDAAIYTQGLLGGKFIGLTAGQYEVVISKDGFGTSLSRFTVCPGGETVADIWMSRRGCLGCTQPKPKLFSTSSTIVTNSQWIGMPDLRCF